MTVRVTATARLAAHVRTPLHREGYALMLSAGLASALGLVYWIIAARVYDPALVGLNAAAISAMLLLSGIAQLNLSSVLTRFAPEAGRSLWWLVRWSYAISLAASAVVAAVFLAGVELWAPRLGFLRSSGGVALWFIGATTIWSIFTLQDSVLTGLRHAIWVPVDNTLFAVAKIGLLAVFVARLPRYGILASWTLGVVLSVVLINALLVFRLIPAHMRSASRGQQPATVREIGRFVGADYVGGLFWLASSTIIPIALAQRLGGSANAFFTLAWVMTMPLYLASANIGNSLVVAAVTDRWRLQEYSQRVFVQAARIVIPAAVGVALAAPFILRLFGGEYATQGTPVLRLLALSAIPNLVSVVYLSAWRAEQRLPLLVWVRGAQSICVIAASLLLMGPYGIQGPAIAWLGVQVVVATGLVLRWPAVLLGGGERAPRRARRLFAVRNLAADSGLLMLAQRIKGRTPRAQQAAVLEALLPRVLADLGGEASSAWSLQQVVRSATDRTVALVGPAGGPARVAVKLAGSAGAAAALAREVDSRRRLCADLRLEEWRSLLPELIHVGRVGGVSYLVERAVSGKEATRLLESGADPARVLRSSMEAFGALHRLTATEVVVDEAVVGAWVDEPLAVLEHYAAGTPRRAWLNIALESVRGNLHEALFGRRLTASSLHGDCVPGNVFLDPGGGRVNGIVDWELATDRDLPALDVLQLILSTRTLMRRRELGEIVLGALEAPWTDDERELLAHAATDGLSDRTLVTLTWLRHTAGMLTKAPAYADNWLWTRANLEAVLVELA